MIVEGHTSSYVIFNSLRLLNEKFHIRHSNKHNIGHTIEHWVGNQISTILKLEWEHTIHF